MVTLHAKLEIGAFWWKKSTAVRIIPKCESDGLKYDGGNAIRVSLKAKLEYFPASADHIKLTEITGGKSQMLHWLNVHGASLEAPQIALSAVDTNRIFRFDVYGRWENKMGSTEPFKMKFDPKNPNHIQLSIYRPELKIPVPAPELPAVKPVKKPVNISEVPEIAVPKFSSIVQKVAYDDGAITLTLQMENIPDGVNGLRIKFPGYGIRQGFTYIHQNKGCGTCNITALLPERSSSYKGYSINYYLEAVADGLQKAVYEGSFKV
jgi:hypothetical protein